MAKVHLSQIFLKLVRVGCQGHLSETTEKQVILTNTLALLYAAFITLFLIVTAWNGLAHIAGVAVLWLFSTLFWIELNRRHRHDWASFGLVLFTDLFGFFFCWLLGKDAQFHYCYFASIGVPLILFGTKKKWVLTFLGLSMACFFALEWMPDSLAKSHVISEPSRVVFHTVLYFTVFLSTFATVFYYFRTNLHNEEALKSSSVLAEGIDRQLIEVQKTLIQSRKMAALGEMAAGVAHEINTPLAAILMNAQMILRVGDKTPGAPPDMLKRAEAIVGTSHRISKIIEGLKLFSTKKEGAAFENFSVQEMIANTLDLCRERLKNHGVGISVEPGDLQLRGHGLPIQVSQALLNLINNAFDATEPLPEKWISIQVTHPHPFIEISVLDSGHGIPAAIAEKIFEPFFTTKELGKGTGLGLSISRGILKKQGGDLFYDPHHPHTRFVILLPASETKETNRD